MLHPDTFNKNIEFNGSKGLLYIGDKILTYRRDEKTNSAPLRIDIPGGGREVNESPFDTFQREVKEEFGINIQKNDMYYSSAHQSVIQPNMVSFFMVAKPDGVKESDIVFGNEGIEYILMSIDEFINRPDGIERQQNRVKDYLEKIK